MAAINTDVDSSVRSLFSVKDYFVTEDGAAEYKVGYDARSAHNFLRLLDLLKVPDYSAQLYGEPGAATLVVVKNQPPPKPQQAARLSTPAFLFLLSLLSVFVTGYVLAVVYPKIAPGSSVLGMGLGFAASLIAVFVLRFLAQQYTAKRGRFSGLSYYLPNVPLFITIPVMYFIPTFGAVSFPASPPANRNKLFDFYLLGALVIVAVAALVSILGATSSVVLTQAQVAALSTANQTLTMQGYPSLLQNGLLSLAQDEGLLGQVPAGGTVMLSPIEMAAWIIFVLAFFNMLPAGLFDGGRMSRLALGEKGSRVTTVLSGAFLLLADLPNYWVAFLLVFLMAAFPVQGETLDSISGLSRSRKALHPGSSRGASG